MVETVEKYVAETGKSKVLVHCWRGGMRSRAVAWLLDLYGFEVYLLEGGYKAYRNWVLKQFEQSYHFKVLGGYTGSGKTLVLHKLRDMGNAVIDLEGLANHKGSAFGHIGLPDQPSREMFENLLATELFFNKENQIWIEDESQRLGHVNVPKILWLHIHKAKVYFLDIPFEERLNYLVLEYGTLPQDQMLNAILRIQKRLGGLETTHATSLMEEGNIKESFRILLKYYDKYYLKSLYNERDEGSQIEKIEVDNIDYQYIVSLLTTA